MALSNAVNWYVRAGGAQTNGGGFDSTVPGAGVNYSDQDAAQLSITDLTSTASTTVTSVLSTFTSNMVGNVLRIASGAGATTGYYMVTTYVNASTITLDRVSGTYTAGVAAIGGATDSIKTYSNGGGGTAPTLTTPLLAGHTVNIRGAGTDDPSTADYTITSFYSFPSGDTTNGRVQFIGYNGRPRINCDGLCIYDTSYARITNMKFVAQNATNGSLGMVGTDVESDCQVDNVYFDQNGNDIVGTKAGQIFNCRFTNSGVSTGGTTTNAAIYNTNYNSLIYGNFIKGWRGDGIYLAAKMYTVFNNVIINCKKNGIEATNVTAYHGSIINNTINGNTLDGIYLTDATTYMLTTIFNNIITTNGGYGINCVTGSSAVNDRIVSGRINYNNYGTGVTANTSGARQNLSAGANDVNLDPQFTSTGTDNYAVGTNMKAIGFPSLYSTTATTSYIDLGGVQRQESGGGAAGMLYIPNMEGT